jgi:hypothetical protein
MKGEDRARPATKWVEILRGGGWGTGRDREQGKWKVVYTSLPSEISLPGSKRGYVEEVSRWKGIGSVGYKEGHLTYGR